jgi:hypothetical protein
LVKIVRLFHVVKTREKVQRYNVHISPTPYPKVVASAASSIITAQARLHGASKRLGLPSECAILVALGKDEWQAVE